MKSDISANHHKKDTYPCLKQLILTEGDVLVVLFSRPNVGVALTKTTLYGIGYMGVSWAEKNFTAFNDKITLKN